MRQRLGDVLVGAGAIDRAGLAQALAAQHTDRTRRRIGEIIVDLGLTTEERIREALAKVLQMPVVNLDTEVSQPDAVSVLTHDAAVSEMILPLRIERTGSRRTLVIGMADPTDLQAVDKLQFEVGMAIKPLLATSSQLRRGIARAYGSAAAPAAPPVTAVRATATPAPAPAAPAPFGAWSGRTPPIASAPAAPPAAPPPPEWASRTPPMGNLASAAMVSDATPIPRTPATAGHPDVIVELRVIGGPSDGLRVPLPPARSLVVGRGEECDLVIPEMFLSRRHFRITRGSAQVELIDLGSSNGTYVNGHPASTAAVKDGDRIQLGRTVIIVSMQRR